jgi:hypothetical protein
MLQIIINISAAATALAALIGLPIAFVKLWPLIKRGVAIAESAERLPEMAQEISRQSETLGEIRHELFPNSGASLRDQTNRIEKTLTEHLEKCPTPPQTTVIVNPGGQP